MNKKHKFNILLIATGLLMAFASCSDWTETESLQIKESNIETDNPDLYAQYLADLRHYRTTDHKVAYMWFDNAKGAPRSRGAQISVIPDSVDIVNLMNPDELSPAIIEEMKSARDNKGMQFVFTVSYLELEKEYEQYLLKKEAEETKEDGKEAETKKEEDKTDEFLAYAANFADRKLALADKYGYDGISVLFYGMKTLHLTEEAREAYLAREAAFMDKIAAWVNHNPGRLFLFEGYPQNLTNKALLQKAQFIVIRTESLKYATGLKQQVLLSIDEGVPVDRFVVTASARDFTDEKAGYYFDANNELVPAIPVAAEWVDTYETAFTKAGLGIINGQNDYYDGPNSYRNIRTAITIMNSSPQF